ncbi:MAG: CAP domain-containing protein [Bacteroidales bacterium]|nr:CAP domain-containing protein [Bacteroidales bacterium]
MRKSLILLIISVFSINLCIRGQEDLKKKWSEAVLKEANTVKDADYLTEQEKEIIVFCNLARLDGELFVETYLEFYLDLTNKEKTRNVKSLIKDLNNLEKLPPFVPEKEMYDIAKDHAKTMGKKGKTGHDGFSERYEKALNTYNMVGENCYYGKGDALDIVITLLIDEGVPNLGHRKNILNESYNSIGVSVQPHKEYGENCVMSFGYKPNKSGGYGILNDE